MARTCFPRCWQIVMRYMCLHGGPIILHISYNIMQSRQCHLYMLAHRQMNIPAYGDTSSIDAPNQSTAKPCSTALRGVGRVRSACTRKTSTLTLHQAFRQNGIKVHLFHRHVHTERDMERFRCTWVREVFKGKSRPTYQHYRNKIVNTNRWFS